MLKLRDFFHLPELDGLVDQFLRSRSGLSIVAGIDTHQGSRLSGPAMTFSSGRSTLFGILVQEILVQSKSIQAIIIGRDKTEPRIDRLLKQRITRQVVEPPYTYTQLISGAIRTKPGLMVVDRLTEDNGHAVGEAVKQGIRTIIQLDSVSWGAGILPLLDEYGIELGKLDTPVWVLTTLRFPALCEQCREVVSLLPGQLRHFPRFFMEDPQKSGTGTDHPERNFYRAVGCEKCHHQGYSGEVAAFDVLSLENPMAKDRMLGLSQLSLEEYLFRLAELGYIPIEEYLHFERSQLQRTYQLLTTREGELTGSNIALQNKLVELEAAHRVLLNRTEVLVSLQEMTQALTSSVNLADLSNRVCQRATSIGGADRAVVYLRDKVDETKADQAVILSVSGWDPSSIGRTIESRQVFPEMDDLQVVASPTSSLPPGVISLPTKGQNQPNLQTGLSLPLIAQGKLVGMMMVHSTMKRNFSPGEVSLLQALVNQAALAIQRTRLIDDLQAKIEQLEAAQLELVKKERMERELELARQVQQNVLPKIFPKFPGFGFAARNEPARQVGGDFYDVIDLEPDHFGVLVADVSDKGMPAALYMALTRSLIVAEARRDLSPQAVLLRVNQLLQELGESSNFVSVFYGVIDCKTREMRYCCAGHDRPMLVYGHDFEKLRSSGAVMGIFSSGDYELTEERITLQPGGRLILYTDGLVDVMDPSGEFFGLHRMENLMNKSAHLSLEEMCERVFVSLSEFQSTADQYDDMTLLLIDIE